MRVLVAGEGESEIGPTRADEARRAALGVLIRRLLHPVVLSIEYTSIKRIQPPRGKGGAFEKKAIRLLEEAEARGFDAAVFLIDRDGPANRERQLQLDAAQQTTRHTLGRAFGVAIEAFEAWLLADETAITLVSQNRCSRQPDPQATRDPKSALEQLLGVIQGKRTLYPLLAEQAKLDVIIDRCPDGFGVFADRVRRLSVA
ncbi:MAG TPA: DUF4276 family protein [Tepidisphaeraceae bacterium]|nr:DUF4276 family protein [Tepidisphaeraceae bacterium]